MPSEPAAVKRTKANSPPCETATASRCAVSFGARPILAIAYIKTNFAIMSPTARPSTVSGLFHTSARSALIPTAMKNSPRSKLLKGSISPSVAGDGLQHRAHHEAACRDDHGDDRQGLCGRSPPARGVNSGIAQERQQREQGDHREILE